MRPGPNQMPGLCPSCLGILEGAGGFLPYRFLLGHGEGSAPDWLARSAGAGLGKLEIGWAIPTRARLAPALLAVRHSHRSSRMAHWLPPRPFRSRRLNLRKGRRFRGCPWSGGAGASRSKKEMTGKGRPAANGCLLPTHSGR